MTHDPPDSGAGQPTLRIELAEWTQRLPTRTRGQVRRQSIAGVVVGAILVLLAVAGGIVRIVDRGFSPVVLGVLVLLVAGGLLCWNGVRRLRWVSADAPDTPVRFTAPYAFEVTDTTIEFPAYQGKTAESWPLDGSTVEVTGEGSRAALRLSHQGRRTRHYPGRGLAESPASVAAAVDDHRRQWS